MITLALSTPIAGGKAYAPGCEDGDDGTNDYCCPFTEGDLVGFDLYDVNACFAFLREVLP